MHKKLKHLIKILKDVFDSDEINKIAKDFLTLNVFHGDDICSAPLSQLASKYDSLFDTQVSKQALDKRCNKHSVEFIKSVFNQMLHSQNTTLQGLENTLNLHFNRVIINDSSSFTLPKELKKEFTGSCGGTSPSAIKIQLQYEFLSGTFIRIDIFSETKNDAEYLKTMKKDKEHKDLKLDDLGYFKVDYLKRIVKSGSSFISKVKSNASLCMKYIDRLQKGAKNQINCNKIN